MEIFNSCDLRKMRANIVLEKQGGLTLREIAQEYLPYCEDINDVEELLPKIKTQWDAYVRLQRKAVDGDEGSSAEIVKNTTAAPVRTNLPKEALTTQNVSINANGDRTSELNISADEFGAIVADKSPDQLLKLHGFVPTSEWTVEKSVASKWQAQAAGGEIIDMVASKVTVKPSKSMNFDRDFENTFLSADAVWNRIERTSSKIKPRVASTGNAMNEKIAILPLADFHLDKREANNSCMSFEKQCQRFYAIVNWFYEKIKVDQTITRIIFFWSQDFFNYDYMTEETTSRRNKQDSSVGYNEMVMEGNKMLFDAIEKLKELAPVSLFYTRSNHDQHTAFNAMCSLYLAFKNDENIYIDGLSAKERNIVWEEIKKARIAGQPIRYDSLFDSSGRSYFKWGECLFGFGHGDKEGQRIFNVMQTEANNQFCRTYAKANGLAYRGNPNELPDFEEKFAWDKTFVHVFFCGHFHSKQVKSRDDAGVEVIYCGTEMSGDAWHEDCGYIGAQRRIEFYTYTKSGDYDVCAIQSRNLKLDWDAAHVA